MDRDGWEETLGKSGVSCGINNSLHLLTFASANNLVVGNTLFQHPQRHKLMWQHLTGEDLAILNYFFINCRFQSSLKGNTRTQMRLISRPCQISASTTKDKEESDVTSEAEMDAAQWLSDQGPIPTVLTSKFTALVSLDDIDEKETQITTTIVATLPTCLTLNPPWILHECLDLVQERKQMKHINFEQYQVLNREVENWTRSLLE